MNDPQYETSSIPPPPSGADLPTEDGIPMETQLHRMLMLLLIESLELAWNDRSDYYIGGNMFFYFSALQARKNDFRGPDVFVVLDTEKRRRDSWVVWEEGGKVPDFILEITSARTESVDRGEKKRIYGKVLHVPEYFIYDPRTQKLDGYRLSLGPGKDYEPVAPDAEGRLEARQLGLKLGPWQGRYCGYEDTWLRWHTLDGRLLPTQEEARVTEQAERRRAEQERQRAEQRAEDLAARLRAYEERFGPLPE
jgi:Uma2 family endonuclease